MNCCSNNHCAMRARLTTMALVATRDRSLRFTAEALQRLFESWHVAK
jgi:hypothetical protein